MIQVEKQHTAQNTVASPCVNVCTLDAAKVFCRGCFRTVGEITAWSAASNAERLGILAAAARRREESGQ